MKLYKIILEVVIKRLTDEVKYHLSDEWDIDLPYHANDMRDRDKYNPITGNQIVTSI